MSIVLFQKFRKNIYKKSLVNMNPGPRSNKAFINLVVEGRVENLVLHEVVIPFSAGGAAMMVAGAVLVVPRRLEAERRVGVQTLCFRHKTFFSSRLQFIQNKLVSHPNSVLRGSLTSVKKTMCLLVNAPLG
jgi:hypothetical protein